MDVDPQEIREPTIFNSLIILFFVGIILFVALLHRQDDLSLLAILVYIVVGGSKVWSRMSGARIRLNSTMDTRRVFPGESIALETWVENRKWLPVWVKVIWSFNHRLEPEEDDGRIVGREAAIFWHQTVKFSQHFVARKRGVYPVGPSRIRTSDLLGFFAKEKPTPDAEQIIVYPHLVPLKPIDIHRCELFGVSGAKSPVQDPIYILGTRDYQPQRPSRHIHWKASARHLRLQEKVFEPSEQAKVLLTLDVESFANSADPACFEHTLEVMASLTVELDKMGYAVGIAANGELTGGNASMTRIKQDPRQVLSILEILARIQKKPKGTLSKTLKKYNGSWRGISCAHFCFEDEPYVKEMEIFFIRQQIPVTFLVYHSDPGAPFLEKKNGIYRYAMEDVCKYRKDTHLKG